jgi:uncharacterized protein YraI
MMMKQLLGAAALLALSTGLAAATPAAVERSANVRSGPGTGYPVIATLPPGTVVDAGPCTNWCRIAWSEGEGYMARSLLALGAGPPAVAVGPAPYYDDYYDDDYPYFGYAYGPSVGVYVPPRRWYRHRPGRPGWGNRPGRPGWGGRPPIGGSPGGTPKIGQSVRSGGGFATGGGSFSGGGAKAGGFGGGGGAAISAPRASAPAASPGVSSKFR